MSENKSKKERGVVRINLEVSPQVRDLIKNLRDKSDATSLAEVFRKSLAIYDLILDHNAAGGKVVLESSKGEREVLKII